MRKGKPPYVPAPPGFKGCSLCRQVKPETDFSLTAGTGRRNSHCKVCKATLQKSKRAAARLLPLTLPPEEVARFWSSVDKGEGCWIWMGVRNELGYGIFTTRHKKLRAHRVSLVLAGVDLPEDKVVDHLCRNKACVNPAHLRVVTPTVNARENSVSPSATNRQKLRCAKGHLFTPDNTAITSAIRGKTRHGRPRTRPTLTRICLTCVPSAWRWAVVKRDPPPNARPPLKWFGAQGDLPLHPGSSNSHSP